MSLPKISEWFLHIPALSFTCMVKCGRIAQFLRANLSQYNHYRTTIWVYWIFGDLLQTSLRQGGQTLRCQLLMVFLTSSFALCLVDVRGALGEHCKGCGLEGEFREYVMGHRVSSVAEPEPEPEAYMYVVYNQIVHNIQ